MSNELMVVHERKVHYINLEDDMPELEDRYLDEDEDVEVVEVDMADFLTRQNEILRLLLAIQKRQEKHEGRFNRIDKHTEAIRDVLKVMNKKLPDSNKEAA